ncbi:MAG: hypothetical protein EXQ96_02205 [Alphaproteobacteria bacterium]|nr:hypothetical protein [Alphaproteobacteria bacterium]
MPGPTSPRPPDSLAIVLFSGDFDRIHYGLAMASAALAIDRPVTLFFTMWASRALTRAAADGTPGWAGLPVSSGRGSALELDASFGARGVATIEELFAACGALGARFLVCEMGLRALGLAHESLRADLDIRIAGLVTFLTGASDQGAMVFI